MRLRLTRHVSLAACGLMLAAAAGGLTASAVADVVLTTPSITTTPSASTTTVTTQATTTAPQASTSTTVATSTVAAAPSPAAVTHRAFASGCPVTAAALELPGRLPSLIGPVTTAPGDAATLNVLRYPAAGWVFGAADVDVSGGGCGGGSAGARVSITSVSVFGHALSANVITLTVGEHGARLIEGLRVGGARVSATSMRWLPLERWGEWKLGGLGPARAALAVRLLRPHAGLPAGTVLLVAAAGSRAPAVLRNAVAKARRRAGARHGRSGRRPLHVTPPLTGGAKVFPVVGAEASFGDTYGALRNDVAGSWHHGDDIFAPLGTPVVAVADGTINRVGWNQVGGWRLWVRDEGGDEFYYAHLSGFTHDDLHSKHVRAGEVIGFVGNTGDAIATLPHLHFEVHPRSLLHLGYDGAVDPTGYLNDWRRILHVDAPKPAHPALPTQPALRVEAQHVWRELLSARHLEQHRTPETRSSVLPLVALRNRLFGAPVQNAARPSHFSAAAPWLLIVLPLALLGALAVAYLRRRSRIPTRIGPV